MGDTSGECIGTNAGINSPGEGVTRLAQLWDFVCLLGSARRSSYWYLFHQPLIIGIVILNDDGYFQMLSRSDYRDAIIKAWCFGTCCWQ